MKLMSSGLVQVFLAVLLTAYSCCGQSNASSTGCEPSPEIQKALDQLPEYRRDPRLTDWQVYQQRLAGVKALLRQYPNDVFVQRTYVESATSLRQFDKASVEEESQATAEYKRKHEQNPENPEVDYLYGLTLVGRDTPDAIRAFDAALQTEPSFPYPHLSLVRIHSATAFLNKEKALTHLKAFLDACPAAFEGYDFVIWVADKDSLNKYGAQLRGVLEARSDRSAVAAYQTLWSIEFKAHPPSEYEGLRKQVGQDLVRIKQLNLRDQREWYETLEQGYKLANDPKQAEQVGQERELRLPSGELPERTKWFKEHPSPEGDANLAAKKVYFTDLLAQTTLWLQKVNPDFVLGHFEILNDRVRALSELDDAPGTDLELAVEQELKYAGENGGGSPWSTEPSPWSDDYFGAAETLSKKHIDPERVIDYVEKGLAIRAAEDKQPASDLSATKENAADTKFYRGYSRFNAQRCEIKAYLQLKKYDRAQAMLAQMDQGLQDLKPLAADNDDRKQGLAAWLTDYWSLRAQDAELQGQKTDAMSFYENALLTRLDGQVKPAAGDELAENAHRLWTSLNGTEEGWQLWYGRRANDLANSVALTWEKTNQPLPPFELADLNNRTWNLAALKGKVVFISFWATWCGPCREELPHLQKLTDSYKGRSDIAFITLSMDENPGLIRPFLDEHQLTLAVIPALNYITETLRVSGIPQNWIMDGQGIVRLKSGGYDSSEKWIADMQGAIEQVMSSAAATAASASK
jgi:thiol-disulfide isomerase/thioredoxin